MMSGFLNEMISERKHEAGGGAGALRASGLTEFKNKIGGGDSV